jgi:hypothetical protein
MKSQPVWLIWLSASKPKGNTQMVILYNAPKFVAKELLSHGMTLEAMWQRYLEISDCIVDIFFMDDRPLYQDIMKLQARKAGLEQMIFHRPDHRAVFPWAPS